MADFIAWNSRAMSVDSGEIDAQHQKLVSMINNLYREMGQGNGSDSCRKTLAELVDYTRSHFTFEETHMRNHDYPQAERHISEHRELLDEVDRLEAKALTTSIELLFFMKKWLYQHILQTDKELGAFLAARQTG